MKTQARMKTLKQSTALPLALPLVLSALLASTAVAEEYLGNLSANPHNENSTANPYGAGMENYGE